MNTINHLVDIGSKTVVHAFKTDRLADSENVKILFLSFGRARAHMYNLL